MAEKSDLERMLANLQANLQAASQRDMATLQASTQKDMATLQANIQAASQKDMATLQASTQKDMATLQASITNLQVATQQDMATLQANMQTATQKDMATLQTNMQTATQSIVTPLQEEIQNVKTHVNNMRAHIQTDIHSLHDNLKLLQDTQKETSDNVKSEIAAIKLTQKDVQENLSQLKDEVLKDMHTAMENSHVELKDIIKAHMKLANEAVNKQFAKAHEQLKQFVTNRCNRDYDEIKQDFTHLEGRFRKECQDVHDALQSEVKGIRTEIQAIITSGVIDGESVKEVITREVKQQFDVKELSTITVDSEITAKLASLREDLESGLAQCKVDLIHDVSNLREECETLKHEARTNTVLFRSEIQNEVDQLKKSHNDLLAQQTIHMSNLRREFDMMNISSQPAVETQQTSPHELLRACLK